MDRTEAAWWRDVRACLQKMTEVVASVARTSLTTRQPLRSAVSRSEALHPKLLDLSQDDDPDPALEEGPALHAARIQNSHFLAELSGFLTALAPQLDRLGSRLDSAEKSSAGAIEEELFWELWSFLYTGLAALESTSPRAPNANPGHPQHLCPELYVAFTSILTWLLQFSRGPAWLELERSDGWCALDTELFTMLMNITTCLMEISFAPQPTLKRMVMSLPPSLLPLLCIASHHITSQRLSTLPFVVLHTRQLDVNTTATSVTQHQHNATHDRHLYPYLRRMIGFVYNVLTADTNAGSSGQSSFLTAPSITHLLKLIVLLPRQAAPVEPDLMPCTFALLGALLEIGKSGSQAYLGSSNNNAAGLPLRSPPPPQPFSVGDGHPSVVLLEQAVW